MTHDCKQTYDMKTNEGLLIEPYRNYTCSRCFGCYVCQHVAVLFEDGEFRWKCRDRKFRPVILDGKVPHNAALEAR